MKKYHFILFIITIIYGISIFYDIYRDNREEYLNKIDNVGDSLSERLLNINNVVTTGSGLYKDNDRYVFKGICNNYILFSDRLWRIISLENDGTIKVVLDDILSNYSLEELDTKFYNSLDKDLISYHSFNLTNCNYKDLKTKKDIEKIKEYYKDYYIWLLDLKDIVNASLYVDFDEYLNIYFWINKNSNYLYIDYEYAIYNDLCVNKTFIKNERCDNLRPALYLKDDVYLLKGKGTKDNPYVLKNENS